jgi:Cu/Ag efflux protein CusF
MKRVLLTILSLAGLSIVWIGRSNADEMRGVIVSVDPAKKELIVKGRATTRGETLTLTLDDSTLVLFGSQKASATDLRSGRRVRVEYERTEDGSRVARVVRATGRPPASGAQTTPTAPAAPSGDAVTGVVQRVARSDREIVVIGPGPKGPETETTIAVPEAAKVVRESKPSSLDGLKEGDNIAVRVERHDGRLTAVEVQAGPGATIATTPAPQERSRVIERMRQALHMADQVLRQFQQ